MMMTTLARVIPLFPVLMLAACAVQQPHNGAKLEAQDGVFVHIKSGPQDKHAVLMGLRMAQIMSADRDVVVYVDVDGIAVITKDAADLKMQPFGSSKGMLQDLLSRNVPIYACPGCLKAAGKTKEDLMPGVTTAEKDKFFAFTKGRILTLDY